MLYTRDYFSFGTLYFSYCETHWFFIKCYDVTGQSYFRINKKYKHHSNEFHYKKKSKYRTKISSAIHYTYFFYCTGSNMKFVITKKENGSHYQEPNYVSMNHKLHCNLWLLKIEIGITRSFFIIIIEPILHNAWTFIVVLLDSVGQ